MSAEFNCCECGRHVVDVVADTPREPPLCALCIAVPSWFDDPKLAALFDPDRRVSNET